MESVLDRSLESDLKLLSQLRHLSTRLLDRTDKVERAVNELQTNISNKNITLESSFNQLDIMSNTAFIESAVEGTTTNDRKSDDVKNNVDTSNDSTTTTDTTTTATATETPFTISTTANTMNQEQIDDDLSSLAIESGFTAMKQQVPEGVGRDSAVSYTMPSNNAKPDDDKIIRCSSSVSATTSASSTKLCGVNNAIPHTIGSDAYNLAKTRNELIDTQLLANDPTGSDANSEPTSGMDTGNNRKNDKVEYDGDVISEINVEPCPSIRNPLLSVQRPVQSARQAIPDLFLPPTCSGEVSSLSPSTMQNDQPNSVHLHKDVNGHISAANNTKIDVSGSLFMDDDDDLESTVDDAEHMDHKVDSESENDNYYDPLQGKMKRPVTAVLEVAQVSAACTTHEMHKESAETIVSDNDLNIPGNVSTNVHEKPQTPVQSRATIRSRHRTKSETLTDLFDTDVESESESRTTERGKSGSLFDDGDDVDTSAVSDTAELSASLERVDVGVGTEAVVEGDEIAAWKTEEGVLDKEPFNMSVGDDVGIGEGDESTTQIAEEKMQDILTDAKIGVYEETVEGKKTSVVDVVDVSDMRYVSNIKESAIEKENSMNNSIDEHNIGTDHISTSERNSYNDKSSSSGFSVAAERKSPSQKKTTTQMFNSTPMDTDDELFESKAVYSPCGNTNSSALSSASVKKTLTFPEHDHRTRGDDADIVTRAKSPVKKEPATEGNDMLESTPDDSGVPMKKEKSEKSYFSDKSSDDENLFSAQPHRAKTVRPINPVVAQPQYTEIVTHIEEMTDVNSEQKESLENTPKSTKMFASDTDSDDDDLFAASATPSRLRDHNSAAQSPALNVAPSTDTATTDVPSTVDDFAEVSVLSKSKFCEEKEEGEDMYMRTAVQDVHENVAVVTGCDYAAESVVDTPVKITTQDSISIRTPTPTYEDVPESKNASIDKCESVNIGAHVGVDRKQIQVENVQTGDKELPKSSLSGQPSRKKGVNLFYEDDEESVSNTSIPKTVSMRMYENDSSDEFGGLFGAIPSKTISSNKTSGGNERLSLFGSATTSGPKSCLFAVDRTKEIRTTRKDFNRGRGDGSGGDVLSDEMDGGTDDFVVTSSVMKPTPRERSVSLNPLGIGTKRYIPTDNTKSTTTCGYPVRRAGFNKRSTSGSSPYRSTNSNMTAGSVAQTSTDSSSYNPTVVTPIYTSASKPLTKTEGPAIVSRNNFKVGGADEGLFSSSKDVCVGREDELERTTDRKVSTPTRLAVSMGLVGEEKSSIFASSLSASTSKSKKVSKSVLDFVEDDNEGGRMFVPSDCERVNTTRRGGRSAAQNGLFGSNDNQSDMDVGDHLFEKGSGNGNVSKSVKANALKGSSSNDMFSAQVVDDTRRENVFISRGKKDDTTALFGVMNKRKYNGGERMKFTGVCEIDDNDNMFSRLSVGKGKPNTMREHWRGGVGGQKCVSAGSAINLKRVSKSGNKDKRVNSCSIFDGDDDGLFSARKSGTRTTLEKRSSALLGNNSPCTVTSSVLYGITRVDSESNAGVTEPVSKDVPHTNLEALDATVDVSLADANVEGPIHDEDQDACNAESTIIRSNDEFNGCGTIETNDESTSMDSYATAGTEAEEDTFSDPSSCNPVRVGVSVYKKPVIKENYVTNVGIIGPGCSDSTLDEPVKSGNLALVTDNGRRAVGNKPADTACVSKSGRTSPSMKTNNRGELFGANDKDIFSIERGRELPDKSGGVGSIVSSDYEGLKVNSTTKSMSKSIRKAVQTESDNLGFGIFNAESDEDSGFVVKRSTRAIPKTKLMSKENCSITKSNYGGLFGNSCESNGVDAYTRKDGDRPQSKSHSLVTSGDGLFGSCDEENGEEGGKDSVASLKSQLPFYKSENTTTSKILSLITDERNTEDLVSESVTVKEGVSDDGDIFFDTRDENSSDECTARTTSTIDLSVQSPSQIFLEPEKLGLLAGASEELVVDDVNPTSESIVTPPPVTLSPIMVHSKTHTNGIFIKLPPPLPTSNPATHVCDSSEDAAGGVGVPPLESENVFRTMPPPISSAIGEEDFGANHLQFNQSGLKSISLSPTQQSSHFNSPTMTPSAHNSELQVDMGTEFASPPLLEPITTCYGVFKVAPPPLDVGERSRSSSLSPLSPSCIFNSPMHTNVSPPPPLYENGVQKTIRSVSCAPNTDSDREELLAELRHEEYDVFHREVHVITTPSTRSQNFASIFTSVEGDSDIF
eukprot:CFRG6976T1